MVRRLAACAALLIVGALIGGLLTWWLRDPHTATAERLTGTVSWSNQETRRIAFHRDGEPPAFYEIVADDLNLPSCLIGRSGDPVREDSRRVEMDALHQDLGGPQQVHIAVSLRCLQ